MNPSLQEFIKTVYTWLVNLTLAAAILAFAIAAIMYLTSTGSADKIKKAQSYLSNAVIALVIVAFSSVFFAFLIKIPVGATGTFAVFNFLQFAFTDATTIILEIGTGLATLLTAYSGVLYMLAAGDAAKQQKAIKSLTTSLIGLVVILAFWALKDFIIGFIEYRTNQPLPTEIINFTKPTS